MKRTRPQLSLRFSTEPDPRYCASVLCRMKRLKKPTHLVIMGKREFSLCTVCARPYESVRGAIVRPIEEAA